MDRKVGLKGTWFGLVLALSLVVWSGIACTGAAAPPAAPAPSEAGTEKGAEQIKLTLWTTSQWNGVTGVEPDGQPLDWTNAQLEKFRQMHPNITVEVEDLSVAGDAERAAKYDAALAAGTIADVIWVDESYFIKYVNLGALESIDDYLTEEDKQDFLERDLVLSRDQGKQWFWPILTAANHMIVNVDLFKERGVEDLLPGPPDYAWSWDQFRKAAEALTFDRDGDGKTDIYGVGFSTDGAYTMVESWGDHLYVQGQEDKVTINTQDTIDAYNALLGLVKDGLALPGSGTSAVDKRTAFLQQQVAIISTWGELEQMALLPEDQQFEARLVSFPTGPNGEPVVWGGTHGLAITVHDDPVKREAAMELARFLTSAEAFEGVKVWTRPARKSVIEAQEKDPNFLYAEFLPQYEAIASKLIPLMGQGPHSVEVITLYESQVEAIFSGDLTPEQALSEFEAKANETLAE
jgi:multiple sugar transport system substrate-binding protein